MSLPEMTGVCKLGKCFHCKRTMTIDVLEQIEYYEGHLTQGSFHHHLICQACKKNALDLGEAMRQHLLLDDSMRQCILGGGNGKQ